MRPGGDWREQNGHVSMVNTVKGHNVIACKCLYENHNCVCWVYANQNKHTKHMGINCCPDEWTHIYGNDYKIKHDYCWYLH